MSTNCARCDAGEHGLTKVVQIHNREGQHVRTREECECCGIEFRSYAAALRFPDGDYCPDCQHVVTLDEGDGYVCTRTDSVIIVTGSEPGDYWSMSFESAIRSAYGPAVYVAYRHDQNRYIGIIDNIRAGVRA